MKRTILCLGLVLCLCVPSFWGQVYDRSLENSSGLYEVRINLKSGFMDREGRLVIRPQFDQVGFFSEGLCAARLQRLWGYIDTAGRWAVQPRFDAAGCFAGGLAAVNLRGRMGYIDPKGKLAVPATYEQAGEFFEGRARVSLAGRWGFIDSKGNRIGPPLFEDARDFSEGLAAVRQRGQWGYINTDGKLAVPPRFDDAFRFQGGAALIVHRGELNFIDTTGRLMFPRPPFSEAEPFTGGLAMVRARSTGRCGFIDLQGKFVVQPRYESASFFWEGLAPVRLNNRWGYIDKKGVAVIDFQYDAAGPFINGIARVEVRGRAAYIDRQGKFIWKPGQQYGVAPVKPVKKEGRADVSLRYDMGGLVVIALKNGTMTYTQARYKGDQPYAAGSPEDYVYTSRDAALTEAEVAGLVKLFTSNGFFELGDTYGQAGESDRYYAVTLSLSQGGKDKIVLFKSDPQSKAPAGFAAIEKGLLDFVTVKFKDKSFS
jgi:hypothetical protein